MRHIIGEAHDLGDPSEYPAVDYKSIHPSFTAMQTKLEHDIDSMVAEYREIVTARYVECLWCVVLCDDKLYYFMLRHISFQYFHLVLSHLISSHLITSYLLLSQLISPHVILYYIILYYLILTYLISSYLILPYLILSYYVSFHLIAPLTWCV